MKKKTQRLKGAAILGLGAGLVAGLLSTASAQDLESLLEGSSPTEHNKTSGRSPASRHPLTEGMRHFLGTPNSEQQVFLEALEASNWEKAVLQWPRAFEGTPFQKSPNGRALWGYVQFQAGLPITGLETLFMAHQPKDLDPTLKAEWKKLAPPEHPAWTLAQIQWDSAWEGVFGETLGLRVKLAEVLSRSPSLEELQKWSLQAPGGSLEKNKLEWQLALAHALNDKADSAAKLLAGLMKSSQAPVGQDLMQLTAARLLFQNGYFDAALKYYEKVPKSSAYWMEAQEEMAWAYVRKGEPHNALALTQSLIVPPLSALISSETFFVRALSQLKLCDYSGVSGTLQDFPKRFKERTKLLRKLSQGEITEEVRKGIELLKSKKIQIQDLGKSAQNLPRHFADDAKLYQLVQNQKQCEEEAQQADVLYSRSVHHVTGAQGSFELLKQARLRKAEAAKKAASARVQELAQTELDETLAILRKLHIVEAELIQQVSLVDRMAKNAKAPEEKKGVTGYKGTDDLLRFPADGEIWFDDLSHYRMDVKKACTLKR